MKYVNKVLRDEKYNLITKYIIRLQKIRPKSKNVTKVLRYKKMSKILRYERYN